MLRPDMTGREEARDTARGWIERGSCFRMPKFAFRRFVPRLHLRIATKVLAFGLFSLLGLAVIGGLYMTQDINANAYRQRAASARINADLAGTLQTTALQLRRSEIEFLFTGNERYSGLHGDLMRMAGSNIQQLEARIKTTDPTKAGNVAQIKAGLEEYGTAFTDEAFVRARVHELAGEQAVARFEPLAFWNHQDAWVLRR